ncbi:MAG: hypothetical protein U0O32_04670 [Collinsella sp.]
MFRSVGTYTIEHKYCKKKHGKNYDHKTDEETFTVEVSDKGVENAYFYFVRPGFLPSSNNAADWYPAAGAETQANMGSINITDMKTDGSTAGNSYDNVANRVVSWPEGLGTPSADGLVLSRSSGYWDTLFEAYKEETGITNKDDVKDIILHPYKISKPGSYHLDCTVEIVAKSTVTADFYVWYPGDTGYTNVDTHIYPLNGDSVSVPVTTQTLKETEEYNGVTYKLYSWYDNPSISGAPVIFPATVSSNVKYYAKYVAQDQTVTVEHVDKATNNVLDSEIVNGLVKGQKVTKYPRTIRGYEVDEDSKNPKTAIAGTNPKIVFYYNAKKGEAGYNLSVPGATWSGDTSDLVPWDKDLKYKYNYGFAKDDTFNVTYAVPVADGKVFIGWLDKARGDQASAIRRAGEKVTYIYNDNDGYCLDALWASLSATGENVPYDGKAHRVTVDAAINDGSTLRDEYKQQAKKHVTLSDVEYSVDGGNTWTTTAPTFVNAGEYPVSVHANVTIDGNETKQLTAETKVVISKRSVVLTSETASKPYDGTPLTEPYVTVSGDCFVEGEVSNIRATGSVTTVAEGEVTNAIDFDKKDAFNPDNYVITKNEGKLSITELSAEDGLTINPNSVDYLYNATKHAAGAATAKASASDTKVNLEYRVKDTGENSWVTDPAAITATDAGVTTIEVRASAANYSGYKYAEQTLTINKRTVELTSAGATKVYDGTPLVNDQVTVLGDGFIESDLAEDVHATGTQTEAGTSNNTISYKLKEGVAKNYNILPEKLGMLTVTAQSIDSKNPDGYKGVTISSPSNSVYDGNEHKWAPEVKDAGGNALKEGTDYTVSYSKDDFTNATGAITVTITGKGNYAGTVTRTYEITKRSVKLTGVKDVTKVYDGTALEAKDVTVSGDGFVAGEVTDIKATGSVTVVTAKPVENPIVFTAGKGFKEGNYTIEKDPGTLQVIARPIDDTTYGMSVSRPMNVEYDGNPHKWAPTVKDGEKTLAEDTDYTVAYDKDDFTNVTGEIKVTITGKGNYAGTIAKSYRITKAPLHVVTGSATKVYDGKALTSETVTIDGLAKRDRIGIAVTGSQTNVGSSQNTYTIDWMQTSADNYELTDELGTLTVTAAPARPSTPTTSVTPTTPTVPNPTPNSSDGGSTTTTAAPTGEDSATGNDQEQKEEKIIDAKNPLGKFDGKKDTCWVHWYMIICAVATAAYGLFVGLRRDKHSRRLQNDLDKVLGNDDETQE